MEDNDFNLDLTGIEFKQDMMEEIKDGITMVIQPSPTPTVWYFPDIEHITFSESRKTMDLDLNIEVYWRATDEIAEVQRSLIYEDTMEGIFKTYFNTSELQFSVDKYTIRIDDSVVTFQWIVSISFLGFVCVMFV